MDNLHELCVEAVRLAGSSPEATVGAWLVSGVLMIIQVSLLISKMTAKKPKPEQVIEQVPYPYIPGGTVLKLLKLLKEQESGWSIIDDDGKTCTLNYGSLDFRKWWGVFTVRHNNIAIPLARNSNEPDLDQQILSEAFAVRLKKEQEKAKVRNAQLAAEAEKIANRELASVLDTI